MHLRRILGVGLSLTVTACTPEQIVIGSAAGVIGSWLCTVLVGVQGCKAVEGKREHIIMLNADGKPVDPVRVPFGLCRSGGILEEEGNPSEWDAYLDRMLADVERFGRSAQKRRLVLFIHGGLNTIHGAIERANKLTPSMLEDGSYPIFINWRSSLVSSYFDHLLFIRQGQDSGWRGIVFSPVYLAGDVARAAVRLPFVWWKELRRVGRSLPCWKEHDHRPCFRTKDQKRAQKLMEAFEKEYQEGRGGRHVPDAAHAAPGRRDEPREHQHPSNRIPLIPVDFGDDERSWGEIAGSMLTWTLTSPSKLATSLFIDSFGTSSWQVMLRRVHLLFHREDVVKKGQAAEHRPTAFLKFLGRLAEFEQAAKNRGEDWEIVLIGHSMGVIVINEILRHDAVSALCSKDVEKPLEHQYPPIPEFDHIVYLAAACSLRDYEDSAFPYLDRHLAREGYPGSQLYHVTLHDRAEELESNYCDLSPRGSLLVWIDDFLANPPTILDRTTGRLTNLIFELHHLPENLEGRVHVKAFGVGRQRQRTIMEPQQHSDFDAGGVSFWQQSFYDPAHRW